MTSNPQARLDRAVADFIAETFDRTNEEVGMIVRLQLVITGRARDRRPGLPLRFGTADERDDIAAICRVLHITRRRFNRLWPEIAEFFDGTDGTLQCPTAWKPLIHRIATCGRVDRNAEPQRRPDESEYEFNDRYERWHQRLLEEVVSAQTDRGAEAST